MIGASFDALYRRLASAAEHYHALERSPERSALLEVVAHGALLRRQLIELR